MHHLITDLRTPAAQRTLGQSVKISSALAIVAFAGHVVIRLGSTIVLTRLLAPEIFGVFAVLMMVLIILTMLSDLGIRSLILTREGELDAMFLRCCWTIQLLRGVAISIMLMLVAGLIALLQDNEVFASDSSYAAPVLPLAIAVTAIGFLIVSAEYPNKFVYERQMQFGRVTFSDLMLALLSFFILVALAAWLRNIWALVIGYIATSSLSVVLSQQLFDGPAMRPTWQRETMAVIVGRGKWIASHSALTVLTSAADRLVLGMFMPASDFGLYHIARQIIELPSMLLNRINVQVGLQVFTELHKDASGARFKERYYRYRSLFDSVAMLSCGGLLTLAPLFVGIVYDDRYAGVATIIQILALGLPLSGSVILRDAFIAQRRFRGVTVLSLVQTGSIWIGLSVALGIFGSVTAALLVVALHRVPETLVLMVMGYREGWVAPLRELRFVPLIAVGAAIGWGMDLLVRSLGSW